MFQSINKKFSFSHFCKGGRGSRTKVWKFTLFVEPFPTPISNSLYVELDSKECESCHLSHLVIYRILKLLSSFLASNILVCFVLAWRIHIQHLLHLIYCSNIYCIWFIAVWSFISCIKSELYRVVQCCTHLPLPPLTLR